MKTEPIAVGEVLQFRAIASSVDPIAVRTTPHTPMAIMYPIPRYLRALITSSFGKAALHTGRNEIRSGFNAYLLLGRDEQG